ncbi:MAG: hypothetical protein J6K52_01545 [Clostridia bacterium]|nr:hypothetical protein [Clostridia bacterium]MBQ7788339.1 hypothetical protein [Clostridia bacterium]
MKIDKKTIDMVLKMNDDQLWKTIQLVAKKSGVESFSNMQRPSDMTKIRSTLASLSDEQIQNALEMMKKGKGNERK